MTQYGQIVCLNEVAGNRDLRKVTENDEQDNGMCDNQLLQCGTGSYRKILIFCKEFYRSVRYHSINASYMLMASYQQSNQQRRE